MLMTILEARVAPERWETLRKSCAARGRLPESGAILGPFLVQGADEPCTWRIATVWRDQEALDAMPGARASRP